MSRKNKKFYIVLIIIVLFGVSVGYAAISRTLTINGNSEVKQNTWDIHFENIQIKNGSVTATKEPTLENSNTSVNFSFMLDLPGDYYEFIVDAVNKGTIDAMIDSVVKTPTLTTAQAKYLNYIIEYQNGEQISSKQLVSKNSFVRIKVRVEYRTDLTENDLPTTTETLNLGFTINYVQADSTGTIVTNNGAKIELTANGSLDDIGTVVTIGSEQFYTIGTEGDNVKLLSMMNITLGDNPIQSSNAGTTEFSNNEQKGTYYIDYNGSIVEGYVNNYKVEIEKLGVKVEEARLITKAELTNEKIGCSTSSCSNAPNWIYSTSYWTGSGYDLPDLVFIVYSSGTFTYDDCNIDSGIGVRPVIVISRSLF